MEDIMEFCQINKENILELEKCLIQLAEYHNQVSNDFKGSFPSKPIKEILNSMQEDIIKQISTVEMIKVKNCIIGFYQCSVKDNIGELNYLYVKPGERHKGYGQILMNRAIAYISRFNVKRIDISVVYGNNAVDFYRKNGFDIRFEIMSRYEE